jgi:hypothetical protein
MWGVGGDGAPAKRLSRENAAPVTVKALLGGAAKAAGTALRSSAHSCCHARCACGRRNRVYRIAAKEGMRGCAAPYRISDETERRTMAVSHLFGRHVGVPEASLALVVAAGLVIPFVPMPGEHSTRIAVRFQTADMPRPGSFTVHTSSNICRVLSTLLTYEDSSSGEFVRIDCGKKAEEVAPQIRAERAAVAGAVPTGTTEPR